MFLENLPISSPAKHGLSHEPSQECNSGNLVAIATTMNSIANNMDDSDDESDLDVRRPLGRAARRMLRGDNRSMSTPMDCRSSPAVQRDNRSDEEDLYSATPMKVPKERPASASSPASVAGSSLFVSPAKTHSGGESENELPKYPLDSKARLAELVAEKRAIRLAREAEEEERQRQRTSSALVSSGLPDDIVEGTQELINPDIERIMSDAAKPTRKSSKRAILEMERETQRIARQQALAHQMKVKRKFTTSDLFAKFNYRRNGETSMPATADGDTMAPSVPHSDVTDASMREPASTPPSSPPTPLDRQRALVEQGALSKMVLVRHDTDGSLTSLIEDENAEPLPNLAEGTKQPSSTQLADGVPSNERALKFARLVKKSMGLTQGESSDDDLEIIQNIPCRLSVFERAKGSKKEQRTDSKAIHTLKHLSHIGIDAPQDRRKQKGLSRSSVNPRVLEAQLRQRAKAQARAQQLERIAELKAKGIEVQTSEERAQEQEAFENLLDKARQDALELRKAEKAAAKGEEGNVAASDDESEDEDYIDESGSEVEEGDKLTTNELVDDVADETDEEEELESDGEEDESVAGQSQQSEPPEAPKSISVPDISTVSTTAPTDFQMQIQTPFMGRRLRKSRVISDDDDDEVGDFQPMIGTADANEDEDDDDPFAAFGFGAAKTVDSLMSPTQAFNATMQTPTQASQQDSMDVLRYMVPPTISSLPPFATQTQSQIQGDSQLSCIPGSQPLKSQPINLAWETQAPETPIPGGKRGSSFTTNDTPGWQPTQDDGLPTTWSARPSLGREDTLETVAGDETQSTIPLRVSESPAAVAPARKRLMRGQRAHESSDDEDMERVALAQPTKKDAFREMARKRREALTAAERAEAEREAKQMMDEQAEESEDEYAGLGGDDFVAPETEHDREMIDSSNIDVDERQLAAHFAERERLADEAATSKLFKDITSGVLRRKQGNLFDLDEDEDDLAVRRRQMRQREEARKRKLLLQDDNLAGLAGGKHSKSKDAFLKAIADDDDGREDEARDLFEVDEYEESQRTQTDSQASPVVAVQAQPLREISGNKRRLEGAPEDRLPAKLRRTEASAFRAPTSLLEVKESVSFLLDEPHAAMIGPSVMEISSGSESEEDEADEGLEDESEEAAVREETERQNDGGFAVDRIAMPPPRLPASQRRTAPKTAVVDRLSLKRASTTGEEVKPRTAWEAATSGGLKAPSLLRRATINTGLNTNDRSLTSTSTLSRENSGSGVKMGGSKKSSLAYQARAEEQRAIVEASAKRRAENTTRIAQLRRAASGGFGKDLSGRFE